MRSRCRRPRERWLVPAAGAASTLVSVLLLRAAAPPAPAPGPAEPATPTATATVLPPAAADDSGEGEAATRPPPAAALAWNVSLLGSPVHDSCEEGVQKGPPVEDGVEHCPTAAGIGGLVNGLVNQYYCRGWRGTHPRGEAGYAALGRLPHPGRARRVSFGDRVCSRGTTRWWRWSSVLAVDFSSPYAAPLCWQDQAAGPPAPGCSPHDVGRWYGTQGWWHIRETVGFHPQFEAQALGWLRRTVSIMGGVFVAMHIRRGDHKRRCLDAAAGELRPLPSYNHDRSQHSAFHRTITKHDPYGACWPANEVVRHGAARLVRTHRARWLFVVADDPKEINADFRHAAQVPVIPFTPQPEMRPVDVSIIEMHIMSHAPALVLNRYSQYSGVVYDLMVLSNRVPKRGGLYWW
eukprot:TRINITY_DN28016_c1_g1_i1.p1 TRINITY_DN28016_c1_g1~~TRINITY_DN28016_c1_g1_i1.p1  ORF type:complete len:431 (+),score=105.43 TRINITY_DN28016_c1_g1_i1:77-1294(+)